MTPYYKGKRLNLVGNQFEPKAHCATSLARHRLLAAKLRRNLIARVIEKHFDVLAAIRGSSAGEPALRYPLGKLVTDFASAGDFVLSQLPDEYGLSAWRTHGLMLLKRRTIGKGNQSMA